MRLGSEGLPQGSTGLGYCLLALVEDSRHAEEAVHHAVVSTICGRDSRSLKALGVGFPFIA
jgi:hypothetical protein